MAERSAGGVMGDLYNGWFGFALKGLGKQRKTIDNPHAGARSGGGNRQGGKLYAQQAFAAGAAIRLWEL